MNANGICQDNGQDKFFQPTVVYTVMASIPKWVSVDKSVPCISSITVILDKGFYTVQINTFCAVFHCTLTVYRRLNSFSIPDQWPHSKSSLWIYPTREITILRQLESFSWSHIHCTKMTPWIFWSICFFIMPWTALASSMCTTGQF